jgi:hypothetical protein
MNTIIHKFLPQKGRDKFWKQKDILDQILSISEIFLMRDFNTEVEKKEETQWEEEINSIGD